MISNDNQPLQDRLQKAWKQSQERLIKSEAAKGSQGYVDLHSLPVSSEALGLINEKQAKKLELAAFAQKNRFLYLAILDKNKEGVDEFLDGLKKRGFEAKVFLASRDSLEYAWSFYRFVPKNTKPVTQRVDVLNENIANLSTKLKTVKKVSEALGKSVHSGSTGDLLEIILAGALSLRASDLHIEAENKAARVRYRVDGVLQDLPDKLTHSAYRLILSRIKLLASLKINITKKSQDGRFSFSLGDITIELRVSVVPSEFGETLVIRILDPRIIQLDLKSLGMREDDLALAQQEIKNPNGMILNTGPTGSGKTTTLYAFLKSIINPELKIITIEDPIEYHLDGIEQTQVDKKKGYTFNNGLEAIMRQDPDIILVGEIRDKETANTAIQSALTGHLVFSTLHTNSASGVIPRLSNLGAPASSIGPAINLVIAQRLVRRLCPKCKKPQKLTGVTVGKIRDIIARLPERAKKPNLEQMLIYQATKGGCPQCFETGYKGRLGVFELLKIGEEMEFLIEKNAGEAEISRFAKKQGMVTLQQDALLKTIAGHTSLDELEKITGPLEP